MLSVLETQVCTKCHTELPATPEFFYTDNSKKDTMRPDCRECCRKVTAMYRRKHRVESATYQVRYYREHQEEKKAYRARYYTTINGHLRTIYGAMKHRCCNPKSRNYKYYGGRGIKCLFTSDEFVDYVIHELKVDPCGLDIDRIDNDGNYEPGNIRFVTHSENQRNKRKRKGELL